MTVTVANIPSAITATQLAAADAARTSLHIVNTDPNRLYFLLGEEADVGVVSATNYTDFLDEGDAATLSGTDIRARVAGIWTGTGGGAALVTKNTDAYSGSNSAIQTYGALKTAVAAWLKPNTSLPTDETANRIPEYISLFEAEATRILGVRDLDAIDDAFAITNGLADIPDGFTQVLSLRNTAPPYRPITFLPIDQQERLDPGQTCAPIYYDRVGSQFVFYPATTTTARLRFRRGLTPLSADSDTNWLLAKHPDAYLYGALRNADRRLVDPDRLALIEPAYQAAMAQIALLDINMPGDGVQMQPGATAVI